MLYQFNLKREVSRSDKQFKIAIISRRWSKEDSLLQAFHYLNAWNRLQRRKEWICESRCQVRDCLYFFCRIFWLKLVPFRDCSLCLVCIFYQACVLFSVCSLAFYTQSAFTPWSAVRSPQSAVRSPQFAVRSPQSAVRSPQSAVRSPQAPVHSPQSAVHSPHSSITLTYLVPSL